MILHSFTASNSKATFLAMIFVIVLFLTVLQFLTLYVSYNDITITLNFKSHAVDPNVKIFYDPGDLANKVKVKLATYNKRSCHYASWV